MNTCTNCCETGETGRYGILDCSAPGCTAAVERVALNAAIEAAGRDTPYDTQWRAYQLGKAAAMREAQIKMENIVPANMVFDMPELSILNRSKQAIKIIQRMDSVEIPRVITPAEESELVAMLRKMWGHAIELGETDYFSDPQFGKADWQADCAAAAKMIANHK